MGRDVGPVRAVYTVGHRAYVAGLKDAHGNVREGWADPVPFEVYAIAPLASQEPGDDRTAVTTGISLLAPQGAVVDPHDRFVVDGVEYDVEGDVADYTRGPFGFAAGLVVNLTRTEG